MGSKEWAKFAGFKPTDDTELIRERQMARVMRRLKLAGSIDYTNYQCGKMGFAPQDLPRYIKALQQEGVMIHQETYFKRNKYGEKIRIIQYVYTPLEEDNNE